MNATPTVILAVAQELSEQAKASLPRICEDERVLREWYEDGVFHRETSLNGAIFHDQYDFRLRKSRRVAVS